MCTTLIGIEHLRIGLPCRVALRAFNLPRKNDPCLNGKGHSFYVVETMGIEPTTSALRTLRSPSMNVYDRKCFLSKKTLSLPAVMRRGLLIVYVYCACKILTNFTVIHCVMPFAVHCDNGSTQHRLLVFKFLIGQSSFRNLVFCIHKGRVAYPPRCRRKRAVRASLRISKN